MKWSGDHECFTTGSRMCTCSWTIQKGARKCLSNEQNCLPVSLQPLPSVTPLDATKGAYVIHTLVREGYSSQLTSLRSRKLTLLFNRASNWTSPNQRQRIKEKSGQRKSPKKFSSHSQRMKSTGRRKQPLAPLNLTFLNHITLF